MVAVRLCRAVLRRGVTHAVAAAGLFGVVAAGAAELPALPPPVEVRPRPKVEMLPPGVKRPPGGFTLADPATAPRREPPPAGPRGPINFDGPLPRLEPLDLSRRP